MDAHSREKLATARALESAIKALEKEIKRLTWLAGDCRASAASWEKLNKAQATAPHLVEWLKAKGSNDPIGEAAEMMDTFPAFIESHYKHFLDSSVSRIRRQRDREIVRLAKNGITNRKIAARHEVSVSTVKRVLKASDLGDYAKPKIKMCDLDRD